MCRCLRGIGPFGDRGRFRSPGREPRRAPTPWRLERCLCFFIGPTEASGDRGGKEAWMIAVMGASGNVGGKTADLLLKQGHEVRVFGRSAERLEPLSQRGAEVV